MSTLKDEIKKILQEVIISAGFDIELDDDMSLIDSGLLDSMSIVRVVQQIQDAFDIDLDFADITLENFDSINVLTPFIESKKS